MKTHYLALTSVAAICISLAASPSLAAKKRKQRSATTTAPTTAPAAAEVVASIDPAYRATAEARSTKIVAALHLDDADRQAKVRDIVANHYVAMNGWQSVNQPNGEPLKDVVKDPAKKGSLDALHARFNQDLAGQLTPAQVEAVKDQMTVNKVQVTYKAYEEIVPNLTDAEKAHMVELLKQAREEAIDGRNMEEKSAIFKIYKGKINIFLTADGHDVSQAYKDWGSAQKAKAHAATQPAATAVD